MAYFYRFSSSSSGLFSFVSVDDFSIFGWFTPFSAVYTEKLTHFKNMNFRSKVEMSIERAIFGVYAIFYILLCGKASSVLPDEKRLTLNISSAVIHITGQYLPLFSVRKIYTRCCHTPNEMEFICWSDFVVFAGFVQRVSFALPFILIFISLEHQTSTSKHNTSGYYFQTIYFIMNCVLFTMSKAIIIVYGQN